MKKGDTAVLICGKMRAGKTTVADYLEGKHDFVRVALADSLKELYKASTGKDDKDRDWLQSVGKGCREVFGKSFWIDSLINNLKKNKAGSTTYAFGIRNLVVDDIRYENELYALYNYAVQAYRDVIVIFVSVSGEMQLARGAEKELLNHESEELAQRFEGLAEKPYPGFWITDPPPEFKHILDLWVYLLDGEAPMPEYYARIERILTEVDTLCHE